MKRFATGATLCLLLLSLLVTSVSAGSFENCPGSCSHQAAIGTTHYDTLQVLPLVLLVGNVHHLLNRAFWLKISWL